MNREQEHSRQYSAGDIRRYLEGKLSPAEMHALEKAALEDPFLADALEGIRSSDPPAGSGHFEADIQELKTRIRNRVKQKNRVIAGDFRIYAWRAAAIIIIFSAGLTVYSYLKRSAQKVNMATTGKKAPAADSLPMPAPATALQPPKTTDTLTRNEEKAAVNRKLPTEDRTGLAKKKAAGQGNRAALSLQRADTLTTSAGYTSAGGVESKKVSKTNKDHAQLPTANMATPAPAAVSSYHYAFTGTVVDQYKQPVSGATIVIRDQANLQVAVSTDKRGNFRLPVNNRDTIVKALVQSAGYQPALVELKNEDDDNHNIIMLHPENSSLPEVALNARQAYAKKTGTTDSIAFSPFIITKDAAPSTGWKQFYGYIATHSRLFYDSLGLHGNVDLSFQLRDNGKMSDFRIEKSLLPEADREAIRLVQQGPAWKLLKGKKARVLVRIPF